MNSFIAVILASFKLVQADASKQLLPLFKTMVANIAASPADLINATTQINLFLASAVALAPTLQKEFITDLSNALIAWAEATAGSTPPAAAPASAT